MAMNLMGALLGGLLEYNSMYFGFQSLYWLAAALYGAGLLLFMSGRRRSPSLA
jgi:predicted MFS family arabinose efflux permease